MSKIIHLNFAAQKNALGFNLGTVIFFIGIFLVSLVGWDYVELRGQLTEVERNLAVLAKSSHSEIAKPRQVINQEIPSLKSDYAKVQLIVKELNFPWMSVFEVLEQAQNKNNVQLLSFESEGEVGAFMITGQLSNMKILTNYMENLKQSALFSSVELKSTERPADNPDKLIKFSIGLVLDNG